MSDHDLVFIHYVDTPYLIMKGEEVIGIVSNEIEYLRILVQIKEQKLEGYSIKDIESGIVCPILSGGRVKRVEDLIYIPKWIY
jgi:hypothetical protein